MVASSQRLWQRNQIWLLVAAETSQVSLFYSKGHLLGIGFFWDYNVITFLPSFSFHHIFPYFLSNVFQIHGLFFFFLIVIACIYVCNLGIFKAMFQPIIESLLLLECPSFYTLPCECNLVLNSETQLNYFRHTSLISVYVTQLFQRSASAVCRLN